MIKDMTLERRRMLHQIVEQNDLGALIFLRPDELVLTVGYMPLWGLSLLLYTRDDDITLFVPELEPEDLLPKDIAIRKYPWGILHCSDPWRILYESMKEVLVQKKIQTLPITFINTPGSSAPCRMSGEQPPLPPHLSGNLSALSYTGFKDVTNDLLKLYTVKTPADVKSIRLTHTVAEIAVKTFYESIEIGISEAELAASIESAVYKMTGKGEIQFAKAWAVIQSGSNAAVGGRYNRTSGKCLQKNELVLLEMGVCVNGYWADISRTAQTSELSSEQKEIFLVVSQAQHKAIEIMKPGVVMSEVDAAAREHIEEAGYGQFFNHALGHPVGFRYHDFGPGLSPRSDSVLEEGMLLTVEPGIYGETLGCGARIEDNVLITNDGHTILSDYPRNLNNE